MQVRFFLPVVAAAATFGTTAGCSNLETADEHATRGKVVGQVTTDGVPVQDAVVLAALTGQGPGCEEHVLTVAVDTTNAAGHYDWTFVELGRSIVGCVKIKVVPDSAIVTPDSAVHDVFFQEGISDSLRIDFEISP